jgi:asparagine synthase (glutamine-hydrolysing)
MCGVAGILSAHDGDRLRPAVSLMARRLRHRGPDGDGLWTSPSGCAVFAHARLAVFDPSDSAAQPLTIDGGLTITYNGAVYNFRSLRDQLCREGVTFRTTSDTEVVLRAYQHYGPSCVDRFEGMFAFAIWDERERRAFLARDPLGIKPLYYALRGEDVLFASEIRALASSRQVDAAIDPLAVYGYLQRGSVAEPRTILRGVKLLPAGACATWQGGTWSMTLPAAPSWTGGSMNGGDPAAETRSALLDSVTRHFAGDVPVGVFLSGGADSAAIAALASQSGQRDVQAFSLAMPDAPHDEGHDSARSAARFGLRHHVLSVDAPTARRSLASFATAIDQPSTDGLNTFIAARFARDHGIKVVASGIGADELFGGYVSFSRVPQLQRWHQRLARTGPAALWAGSLLERTARSPRVRRIGDLLQQPPTLEHAYNTFRAIFTRAEARRLTRHLTGNEAPAEERPAAHVDSVDDVSSLELTRYVRNQLLRDADVMGMASGVEVRTPFVDRRFATTMWALPQAVRLQHGKKLLADAVPEIPPWAFSSPKRCFQFPFDRWLDGEWRDLFAEIDAASPVPLETWYRKWCVFSMEQAMRNVSEASRD